MAIGSLEVLLFATLLLGLSCWLAFSVDSSIGSQQQPSEGTRRKRLVAYGCLGGVIGLGLWSNMLVLPFVCTSLLLLLLFCRSELRTRASLFGLLGFVIGAFPLLLFNIQYPLENSLVTLWNLHSSGGASLAGQNLGLSLLLSRLEGTIVISIPMATGTNSLCPISAEPSQWVHQLSLSCTGFQACWGLGVIIVWTLALFTAVRDLQRQRQTFSTSGSAAEKEHLARCTGRLMLLASVGLTVLSYATSPAPAVVPVTSSRYLAGLLVATPAIVAFLWPRFSLGQVASTIPKGHMVSRVPLMVNIVKISFLGMRQIHLTVLYLCKVNTVKQNRPLLTHALGLISLILILGTSNPFHQISGAQRLYQRQDTLIDGLLRLHAPHIYSDYWTCDRLIFLSNERIICSVLEADLGPGQNCYEPYAQIVKQDPHSVYVFDTENGTGISQDKAFTQRFGAQYLRLYLAEYAVYLPMSKGNQESH
jgi:NO-binding membrane sensor protein with MHYT domain